jgi:hypothetical protein
MGGGDGFDRDVAALSPPAWGRLCLQHPSTVSAHAL